MNTPQQTLLAYDGENDSWNFHFQTISIERSVASPAAISSLNLTMDTLRTLDEIVKEVNPPNVTQTEECETKSRNEDIEAANTLCDLFNIGSEPPNGEDIDATPSTYLANNPMHSEGEWTGKQGSDGAREIIGLVQLEETGEEVNEEIEKLLREASDVKNETNTSNKTIENSETQDREEIRRGKKRPRVEDPDSEALRCTSCCKRFKQKRYLVAHVRKGKCPAQDVNPQDKDENLSNHSELLQCRRCGQMGDEEWLSTHDYKTHPS